MASEFVLVLAITGNKAGARKIFGAGVRPSFAIPMLIYGWLFFSAARDMIAS